MPILAMLLLAAPSLPPPCRADALRVSLDGRGGGRGGDFSGMSHSGTELSVRNVGPDCMIVALPKIEFLDMHNRILSVARQAPRGMHPGPVMVPIRLAAGHRASTDLRWVAGPVFPHGRSVHAAKVRVRIGSGILTAPLSAVLCGEAAKIVTFEQTPLQAVEGMAQTGL